MSIAAATVTDLSRVVQLSEQLTASYLEYAGVLPLECRDGVLRLATWRDSVDEQVLDDLRVLFDADVEMEQRAESDVRSAIQRVSAREHGSRRNRCSRAQ